MSEIPCRSGIKNKALIRLMPSDLALLKPDLVAHDLPVFTQLETAHRRIHAVYFLETGFASVVADSPRKRSIEVGIIGREGMTGLSVVLGHDRSHHQTYIQAAAAGHCISAARLRANGRSKNEERLARWLLMAHDRLDGRVVPLSHDLLAVMLGVHRPAVSVALKALERRGLVRPGRVNITILNRKGLERYSKGAYVAPDPL
jgi:CRP-like cAMP-binding protein